MPARVRPALARPALVRPALVVGALVFGALPWARTAAVPPAGAATPTIGHVVTVVLENTSWETVRSRSGQAAMPFLSGLASSGVALDRMFGVDHNSLTNYVAMTSGHTSTATTKANCPLYDCVYESPADTNLGDQLEAAGRTWKAYLDGMPAPCTRPVEGGGDPYQHGYATRHNPFVYYRDVVSDPARCAAHDVPFSDFATDLGAGTLPDWSLVVPDTCNDAHDGGTACGLDDADRWLAANIGPLLSDPAFTSDGMLVVTFDESVGTDHRGCCTNAVGGHIHTVVWSPKITIPGRTSAVAYSHFSLLRTVEQLFGLPCLDHACDLGTKAFGADVWGPQPSRDFAVAAPAVVVRPGTGAAATVTTTTGRGTPQTLTLKVLSGTAGVTASITPTTVTAGATATLTVSAASSVPSTSTVVQMLATGSAGVVRSFAVPVDVLAVPNGDFEAGTLTPWVTSTGFPPTIVASSHGGVAAARTTTGGAKGTSSLRQTLVVPIAASGIGTWVRITCTGGGDGAAVLLTDQTTATTTTVLVRTCTDTGAWQWVRTSLAGRSGHRVQLQLVAVDNGTGAATRADWDDVTLD